METKEEILALIKKETGWTDEQCLAFYEQEEKMHSSQPEETCPVFYAYYTENETTGRRTYGVVTEEVFISKKIEDKAYDYKRCFREDVAKEQVKEWKGEVQQVKNWDRYMNG